MAGTFLVPKRDNTPGVSPTPDEGNYAQGLTEKNSELGNGVQLGYAVKRNVSTGIWEQTDEYDAEMIVDAEGEVIRPGHLATLAGLTPGAKYYIHPLTQVESAVYDEESFNAATMSTFKVWKHNNKIYELATTIYQYTYVKGDTASWAYDSKSKNISGYMTKCEAAAAVASKVFLCNSSLDTPNHGRIKQFSWTPDDISTLSDDSTYFDVLSDIGLITFYFIKAIGDRLYVCGFVPGTGTVLAQYYVSDWTDITTASHEYTYTFSTPSGFDAIGGIGDISGNKLYLRGSGSASSPYDMWYVVQYSIPDFEDIRTIEYDNKYYDASAEIDQGNQAMFAMWFDEEYMYLGGDEDTTYDPYWYQYLLAPADAIGNLSEEKSPMEAGRALTATQFMVDIRPASSLVAETEVLVAASNIEIDGLNIVRDGGIYDISINGRVSSASVLLLYVNADTTDTNYYSQYIKGDNTTISGGRDNAPIIGYMSAGAGATNSILINILLNPVQKSISVHSDNVFDTPSGIEKRVFAIQSVNTFANITKITISSANNFAVGTKIKVYRRGT